MAISSAALSLGDVAIRQLDGLYSLNDLHAAAGGAVRHQPTRFVRLDGTKALIAELGASPEMVTPLRTVNDGQHNGTYACRELVIAYAAWISAAFHLKVIRVFLAQATEPAQPAEHPMAYKQMLVRFDHLGRPGMGQILSDDTKVLSCTGMAAAIRSPNAGGWSNEVLLDLAEAIHARLTSEARRIFAMQRKENSHV
jgi:KilA-N domain